MAALRHSIEKLGKQPDVAVAELSNTSKGISFLLSQFQLLKERLTAYYSFEVSQREYALKISGLRPDELFNNKDIFDFDKAYLGAISGPGSFTAGGAGNALQHDKPDTMTYTELVRRLKPLVCDLPTVEEGNRRLHKHIAKEVEPQGAARADRLP